MTVAQFIVATLLTATSILVAIAQAESAAQSIAEGFLGLKRVFADILKKTKIGPMYLHWT